MIELSHTCHSLAASKFSSRGGRSSVDKQNMIEITKKIHKSHREKRKRDHLNEVFLKLERSLEQAKQNNSKASILSDATKILQDLIFQVESLKQENANLITETRYVTTERDELKDEASMLWTEFDKLKNELSERGHTDPSWNNATNNAASLLPGHHSIESHSYLGLGIKTSGLNPPYVMRPHARYPNSSDSRPQRPLFELATFPSQSCNSGTSSTTTCNNSTTGFSEMEGSGSFSPRELHLL